MNTQTTIVNDFSIQVASINGSGSQSANNILAKTLFRMGIPVGAKNLFPSNIQGLPTWFTIRINKNNFVGFKGQHQILLGLNNSTLKADLEALAPGGIALIPSQVGEFSSREDITVVQIPLGLLVNSVTDSPRLKKLLLNMVAIGVLAECLGASLEVLLKTLGDQFVGKEGVLAPNKRAVELGVEFAQTQGLAVDFPFKVAAIAESANKNLIFIDGNSAAALGMVAAGCTMVSWYPITPSSSVVEAFESFAASLRCDEQGKKSYAVIQAEDELAAIAMVIGAGWAGARALTATSGPGLSLMAEAAGLSYFAEIPAVIWNVQRAGPSTGLPTRTLQGDLLSSYYLSHGDTKHICLFPANPLECFEFARTAFDLSEQLQTLVIVLSDLDLGMNYHMSECFELNSAPLNRGKVLTAADLTHVAEFARYRDVDGDGVPQRTLPGTDHPLAGYFTRGTGHNENAEYSESPQIYEALLQRLERKWQTAANLVPKPMLTKGDNDLGVIGYGSSDQPIREALEELRQIGLQPSYMRIRALPAGEEIAKFLLKMSKVYIVEQNRDGQLKRILAAEFPEWAYKLKSIVHFTGWPLTSAVITQALRQELENK